MERFIVNFDQRAKTLTHLFCWNDLKNVIFERKKKTEPFLSLGRRG